MRDTQNISLSCIIILLGFLILAYLNYTVSQERQMLIANRLYSTWSVELIEKMEFEQIIESLPRNSRVFFEHNSNRNIRTFYQNGTWQPPMISGVFFDRNAPYHSAVVGEYHVQTGATTIEINNIIHEIIGVIGAGYPSVLDRLILVNTLPDKELIETIIIDTRRAEDRNIIFELFNVQSRHHEESALDFLGNYILNTAVRRSIISISIVLSFLLGYIYLNINKNKTKVLYLVGYGNFKILLKNTFELIFLVIISFSPAVLIDVLFGHRIVFDYWHFYLILLLLIVVAYIMIHLLRLVIKFGGELSD